MNFIELCEELRRRLGTAPVTSNLYAGVGDGDVVAGDPVLRGREGIFEVGAQDRGAWVLTASFETEAAACAYLLRTLVAAHTPPQPVPAEEDARARKVTADFDAELRRMFPGSSS